MSEVKTEKRQEGAVTSKVEGSKTSGFMQISTGLIGKEEVFRMLQVAKGTGLPLLLIGEPGVSKTGTVLDYAHSAYPDPKEAMSKVYILETDEGTKTSEIKGTLNVKALVIDNEFKLNTPVAHADFVVINEVDKASSGLRNAMLGVMNEKIVFNGAEKIPCNWKIFVATANKIPKEEMGNPFWDRFPLKVIVNRVSAGEMLKYYKNGDKKFKQVIKVPEVTEELIDSINIDLKKLETFVGYIREHISDRSLSFVPRMAKVVSIVYNTSTERALVKVCELLTNNATLAKELSKKLSSVEKRTIMDKLDLVPAITDPKQLENAVKEIEKLMNDYHDNGKLSKDEINELLSIVKHTMSTHQLIDKADISDDLIDGEAI